MYTSNEDYIKALVKSLNTVWDDGMIPHLNIEKLKKYILFSIAKRVIACRCFIAKRVDWNAPFCTNMITGNISTKHTVYNFTYNASDIQYKLCLMMMSVPVRRDVGRL